MSWDQIAAYSKQNFKRIVKDACKNAAFNFLIKQKSKLSKGSNIVYTQLQTQNYLMSGNNLSIHTMRQIYDLRVRNTQVKCNFPGKFSDTKCLTGCGGEDSLSHIWECN